jgi:hypothetical protein
MPRTGEPLVAGQTYRFDGEPELCVRGLHASRRAIDALGYSGPWVSRVECSGKIVEGRYKLVCTERRIVAIVDATNILHEFACWCAEQSLLAERAAGREPDPRSWAAIDAKRKWLRGEVSDKELESAARSAAESARSAARSAARLEARSAWSATWSNQTAKLESMLLGAMGLEVRE